MNCPNCGLKLDVDQPVIESMKRLPDGATFSVRYRTMSFQGTADQLAIHMGLMFEYCVQLRTQVVFLGSQVAAAKKGPEWHSYEALMESIDCSVAEKVAQGKAEIDRAWSHEVIQAREARDAANARVRELEAELAALKAKGAQP